MGRGGGVEELGGQATLDQAVDEDGGGCLLNKTLVNRGRIHAELPKKVDFTSGVYQNSVNSDSGSAKGATFLARLVGPLLQIVAPLWEFEGIRGQERSRAVRSSQ